MKYEIGNKVKVSSPAKDLPHPQHLYAGQTGEIKAIWGNVYKVAFPPDIVKSGSDATTGVEFYEHELTEG